MPPKKVTKNKAPSPSPPPAKRSTRSKKEDKVDDKKKDVVAKVTKDQSKSKGKGKAKQKTPSPSPSPPPKKAPVRKDSKKSNKKSPSPQPIKAVKKSPSPAKKEEDQNLKKLVFTGKAPVDEFVLNRDNYIVFEDAAKVLFIQVLYIYSIYVFYLQNQHFGLKIEECLEYIYQVFIGYIYIELYLNIIKNRLLVTQCQLIKRNTLNFTKIKQFKIQQIQFYFYYSNI